MELGSEEVFENESQPCSLTTKEPPQHPTTATFVETVTEFANSNSISDQKTSDCLTPQICQQVEKADDNESKEEAGCELHFESFRLPPTGGSLEDSKCNSQPDEDKTLRLTGMYDRLNNNEDLNMEKDNSSPMKDTAKDRDTNIGQCNISKIVVNRSYAKGDSTFSIAVRRDHRQSQPFSSEEDALQGSDTTDTRRFLLENFTNQNRLDRLQRGSYSALKSSANAFASFAWNVTRDMGWTEVLLFISASTFIALCLELPPSTFMLDILAAIVIKAAIDVLMKEL